MDAFIFIADLWNAKYAIDGRYIWLPIKFTEQSIEIDWKEEWNLSVFDKNK